MVRLTLAAAKQAVARMGYSLSCSNGEYRLNLRHGTEVTAYYTNDLRDAVDTAKAWASHAGVAALPGHFNPLLPERGY